MISYSRIKSIAAERGVLDIVIEKDYVLDWILWGLSENNYLKNNLVFKGGTALHKMYFSDWRFSEDLDFTSVRPIQVDRLKEEIVLLCKEISNKSGMRIELKRVVPSGDSTEEWSHEIKIEYIGPRQQSVGNLPVVLLHITNNEPILYEPNKRIILNPYEDIPGDFFILTYPLEEILAEKLRTVLYQRCYPRDVYDLWRLIKQVGNYVDLDKLIYVYGKKCRHRGIEAWDIPDNINERIERLKNGWAKGLQRLVSAPPEFEVVYQELMENLKLLFYRYNIFAKGGINMIESNYVLRYKKGDIEIEVQGDKTFVEEKFKELLNLGARSTPELVVTADKNEAKREAKPGEEISLVEFFNQKKPKSHGDKLLVFGYYLEKIRGYEAFNIDDIEKCYQDARVPKTKNFSQYITWLIRKGYLMDHEQKKDDKKAWVLTKDGQEYVENYGKNVG
jgi:predicted nucleotidyltransferase component of viral defense system